MTCKHNHCNGFEIMTLHNMLNENQNLMAFCNIIVSTQSSKHPKLLVNNNGEEGPEDLKPKSLLRAVNELKETSERRREGVVQLRALAKKDANLLDRLHRDDDKFYLRYLRARKFEVDRAFKLLNNHMQYPEKIGAPLLHQQNISPGMLLALETGVVGFLPKRDTASRKILFLNPGKWDMEKMPLADMHKLVVLIMETLIESEETQVNGFSVLCNAEGLSYKQLFNVLSNTELVYNIISLVQDTIPGRLKEAVIFNNPWYINLLRTIFPLMKKKFRERTRIIGYNLENIGENFHPDCLPQEYGGNLPKIDPSFSAKALKEAFNYSYYPFNQRNSPNFKPQTNSIQLEISCVTQEKLDESLEFFDAQDNMLSSTSGEYRNCIF